MEEAAMTTPMTVDEARRLRDTNSAISAATASWVSCSPWARKGEAMTKRDKPPTLARLRKLAKAKGYDMDETIGTLEVVPNRDDDSRPVMTLRYYEIAAHRAMARLVLFAALSALPDKPKGAKR